MLLLGCGDSSCHVSCYSQTPGLPLFFARQVGRDTRSDRRTHRVSLPRLIRATHQLARDTFVPPGLLYDLPLPGVRVAKTARQRDQTACEIQNSRHREPLVIRQRFEFEQLRFREQRGERIVEGVLE